VSRRAQTLAICSIRGFCAIYPLMACSALPLEIAENGYPGRKGTAKCCAGRPEEKERRAKPPPAQLGYLKSRVPVFYF
jgi:hypothetical protein